MEIVLMFLWGIVKTMAEGFLYATGFYLAYLAYL